MSPGRMMSFTPTDSWVDRPKQQQTETVQVIKRIAAVAALFISFSLPHAAFAYGAIAVDDEVGDDEPGYGLAVGEDTQEAAKRAAMKYCSENGNKHCKVAVWFKQCGAYAASNKYYGYGYGPTKAVARTNAMKMCAHDSCEVKIADCED